MLPVPFGAVFGAVRRSLEVLLVASLFLWPRWKALLSNGGFLLRPLRMDWCESTCSPHQVTPELLRLDRNLTYH